MVTLIDTKLRAPQPQPELLLREQLFARLDKGVQGVLTLLVAPAGYGKTRLVSTWLYERGLHSAWLALDAADNEPARFWAYLLATLKINEPLALPENQEQLEPAFTTLINRLLERSEPLVLVLDNYQVMHSPAIQRGMQFLLDHMPGSLHLVLLSRQGTPFALERLRFRGQLEELYSAELAFSKGETALLLERILKQPLLPETVTAFYAQSEGWPVALSLASLSLRRQEQPANLAASLQNRAMLDYCLGEVLAPMAPPLQEFVLTTVILDRFDGVLCDQFRATSNSQQQIAELQARGLLVAIQAGAGQWYRYHSLFAALLRSHLRAREPARWRTLHQQAVQPWLTKGVTELAIEHALLAEDWATAAALMSESAPTLLLTRREPATLLAWQQRLPATILTQQPGLPLYLALAHVLCGQLAPAAFYVESISDAETTGLAATVRACLAYARDDLPQCMDWATIALEQLPVAATPLRNELRITLARAYDRQGTDQAASALCEEILQSEQPTQAGWAWWIATFLLGQIIARQGRLREAEQFVNRQLRYSSAPLTGYALLARSCIYGERFQLVEALADAEAALAHLRGAGEHWVLVQATCHLAMLYHLAGNTAASAAMAAEAAALLQQTSSAVTHALYAVSMAHLAILRYDLRALVHYQGTLATNEVQLVEYQTLVLGWRALLLEEPAAALSIIDPAIVSAQQAGRRGRLIELLLLRALVYVALGQQASAEEDGIAALQQAAPEGHIRPFIEQQSRLGPLLWQLQARSAQLPTAIIALLNHIVRVSEPPEKGMLSTPQEERPELTSREREVLLLLNAGASNRVMAQQLILSEETIRSYLKQLYRKLEVSTRTQAIARAHSLGYLPATGKANEPA